MPRRIIRKWRPPLWFVLAGVLGVVLLTPLLGVLVLQGASYSTQSLTQVISLILLVTAILGWLLWRLILRPVTSLARRAEAIESGNTSARAPLEHYGTPELVDLGQSVLNMARSLHDREANIRTYTNHIAHELKAPLTAIAGAAELLEDAKSLTPEDRALIGNITASAKRMETLLIGAGDMAAAREPGHIGLSRLSDLLPQLAPEFPAIEISASGETVTLPLAQSGLVIVLRHLISNAIRHGATHLKLTASTGGASTNLAIEDDGNGISEGNRKHVFEPFFTTNRDAGGTGMGLAIVQSILTTHGAEISLIPMETGAKFSITF